MEKKIEILAQIDPNDPGSIKIYSRQGFVRDGIELKVDYDTGGSDRTYASPAFGEDPMYKIPDEWDIDKQAYILKSDMSDDQTTTVCDGL